MLYESVIKENQFYTVLVLIGVYLFFRIINIQSHQVSVIFLALILSYYFYNLRRKTLDEELKLAEYKLKFLNNCLGTERRYLYTAPMLANFLYDIKEYALDNYDAFCQMVISVNNLLMIEYESYIGLRYIGDNVDEAKLQMNNALNHFHSIIYSLPSTSISNEKFTRNMRLFQRILYSHYINIKNNARKAYLQRPLTKETKSIVSEGPEPNPQGAPDFNSTFSYFY